MKFTVIKNFGNYKIPITYNKIPKSSHKMTKYKAYVIAVLCGDGNLYFNPKSQLYQIVLQAVDKDFVTLFQKYLENIYHLKVSLHKRKSKNKNWNLQYKVRLCSKMACLDLLTTTKSFFTKTWRISDQILASSTIIKSYFLKGLYDSEGDVDIRYKRIGLTSINKIGLQQVQILLSQFKIRSTIIKRNAGGNRKSRYVLRIQDRKSVTNFSNKISFGMHRKEIDLKKLINSYKLTSTPHIEVLKNIEEMRKLRNQNWSYQKIANKFNIGIATVWNNLN